MIARVFPRRTRATPDDPLAFVDGPGLFPPEVDAVHVSVAFTWDLPRAEWLAKQWEPVAPVLIGGPATGERSHEFIPCRYLKYGYTITSRGCPNRCWFCSVPIREGAIREQYPIPGGWNVLDDNLLACSDDHVRDVFTMLATQPRLPEFTGGIEAKRLRDWHVDHFLLSRTKSIYFAFDTPDDEEPLRRAARMMTEVGFDRHVLRCYVLIGHRDDTFEKAESRLRLVLSLGMDPMAMLYHDGAATRGLDWKRFQRMWARPALMHARQIPA